MFILAMVVLGVAWAMLGYRFLYYMCNTRKELYLSRTSLTVLIISVFGYLVTLFGAADLSNQLLTLVSCAALALVFFIFVRYEIPKDMRVMDRVEMRRW